MTHSSDACGCNQSASYKSTTERQNQCHPYPSPAPHPILTKTRNKSKEKTAGVVPTAASSTPWHDSSLIRAYLIKQKQTTDHSTAQQCSLWVGFGFVRHSIHFPGTYILISPACLTSILPIGWCACAKNNIQKISREKSQKNPGKIPRPGRPDPSLDIHEKAPAAHKLAAHSRWTWRAH